MRRAMLCSGLLSATLVGCTVASTHERVVEQDVVVERGPVIEREVVVVDEGPPPPDRVEVITVRPYAGAVWARGHWIRERRRWIWVPGHWR